MFAPHSSSGIDINFLLLPFFVPAAYKAATVLYDVFFSPLAAIPGPWYAAASDFWLIFYAAQFLQCNTLHSLFDRYGPIVRVGPRRVVFCDRDAMKSVYCVNKLHKSSFYKVFMADSHDNSMTSITEGEHRMRRKTFAAHYAISHVLRFQSDIKDCVENLVKVLDTAPPGSVDTIHLLRHLSMDIVRITILGMVPSSLDAWRRHLEDPVCAALRDFPTRAIFHSVLPSWLWSILRYLPHERWRQIYYSDSILAAFVRERLLELEKDIPLGTDLKERGGPTPLIARMLQHRLSSPSPGSGLSDQDIVSECMAHLVAGVDTSTATFGFMLWELSRRPGVVRNLRAELSEVVPDRRTLPDYGTLLKQPYLSAFLNEGFRMYGAVSALLERVVPPTKDDLHPFDLMGFALPPGTVVGTQAWSMHRDPDVFPNPEFFEPERWLPSGRTDDAERLSRMSQYLTPFGFGTRACPGRYQAHMTFRTTIAALVLNFDLVADPRETNEATMAPRDAFAVRPASKECKLSFIPRPT